MTDSLPRVSASVVIPKTALQRLFDNLRGAGFQLIGPTVRDGTIVLEEITNIKNLPVGWVDEQQPGRYRLLKSRDKQYFGFVLGPHSWKRYLHIPEVKLFSITKENGKWTVQPNRQLEPRRAFVGVRSCELHAMAIQDRVLLTGEFRDPQYARRREQIFLLAVNCTHPASTCFCTSMKTGPRASGGFDLALTELPEVFVVEIGSEAGSDAMRGTGWQPATAFEQGRATQLIQQAERQILRELRTDDLPKMMYDNLEHPRWDEVGNRCLSCGNCTQVCPTCFCTTVNETSDLRATNASRVRVWDSCFISDFSQVHGGNIRPTVRSRYRQWLTHKFASWIDQFGTSGCVGCGRCITWCPVGIDVTEEIKALRTRTGK